LMRLQPKDLARHLKEDDNIDLYSIQISSSRRDFTDAFAQGGFQRRKTGWVVLGNPIILAKRFRLHNGSV